MSGGSVGRSVGRGSTPVDLGDDGQATAKVKPLSFLPEKAGEDSIDRRGCSMRIGEFEKHNPDSRPIRTDEMVSEIPVERNDDAALGICHLDDRPIREVALRSVEDENIEAEHTMEESGDLGRQVSIKEKGGPIAHGTG